MTAPVIGTGALAGPDEGALRAVVEQLAPIRRLPTSDGERVAAHLLAERLRRLGCEVVDPRCQGRTTTSAASRRSPPSHRFPRLPRHSTWFLNLDTVGSGRLVLLEGEGPLRMRDYHGGFKDLVAACAVTQEIRVLRGLRSHNSTDAQVPNRAGYPVATLVSVDGHKLIPHYHLETDTPDNLDYGSVADAARLAEGVARAMAARRDPRTRA